MKRLSQGSLMKKKALEVGVNSSVIDGARSERVWLPRSSSSSIGRHWTPKVQVSNSPLTVLSTRRPLASMSRL